MNKCGGRGRCRYCGELHDNVAYHEVWACDQNPNSKRPQDISLETVPQEIVLHAKSLIIHCNSCHKQITEPAAILFSPPKETTRELMMVKKFHLCHTCYGIVYDTLKLEISKYDPQRTPNS